MRIKIYQVNMERDENRVAFMGMDSLPRFQGNSEIDSGIYDLVFAGEVNCQSLEEIYQMFNLNHPTGYKARSLSVSDVVEVVKTDDIESGFYFCDSFGFQKVLFDQDKAQLSEHYLEGTEQEKIAVLLVQPNKFPRMIEIDGSLEAMQKIVGGYIEEYMPFSDEVAIICNEEGKMSGCPLNRAIYSETDTHEMIDIIAGDFFIAYAPAESEKFLSLPPDLAKKYETLFKNPERFYRNGGKITAVPYNPQNRNMER